MHLEIKAAGGLTRLPLRNRTHLAHVSSAGRAWMNAQAPSLSQVVKKSIKQEMLEDALHHIAFGEQVEAMKIIEMDITLLECTNRGAVTLCSPERECLDISIPELVRFLDDFDLPRDFKTNLN